MAEFPFIDLFNKAAAISLKTRIGKCKILESNPAASLKELEIVKRDTKFSCFNEKLLKSMPHITTTRSSFLLDKECDGVVLYKDCVDGIDCVTVLLSDLKSKFCSKELAKALSQVEHSFFKFACMWLISNNDVNKINIHFVLACQNFENNSHYSAVLNDVTMMLSSNNQSNNPFGNLLRAFLAQTNCTEFSRNYKLGDFYMMDSLGSLNVINSLPIDQSIKNLDVKFTIKVTDVNGNRSATLQV